MAQLFTECEHCPPIFDAAQIAALHKHCSIACMALHMWRRNAGGRPQTIAPLVQLIKSVIAVVKDKAA